MNVLICLPPAASKCLWDDFFLLFSVHHSAAPHRTPFSTSPSAIMFRSILIPYHHESGCIQGHEMVKGHQWQWGDTFTRGTWKTEARGACLSKTGSRLVTSVLISLVTGNSFLQLIREHFYFNLSTMRNIHASFSNNTLQLTWVTFPWRRTPQGLTKHTGGWTTLQVSYRLSGFALFYVRCESSFCLFCLPFALFFKLDCIQQCTVPTLPLRKIPSLPTDALSSRLSMPFLLLWEKTKYHGAEAHEDAP